MRKITEIIVHCTATPAGLHVSADDVDRWHKARGFKGIGYHYLVGTDGLIEFGRPENRIGAHCLGHNAHSIGVAYAGGLDADGRPADTRTTLQKAALCRLLTELRRRYPGARIRGHRDFAPKACPCFDATAEYSGI